MITASDVENELNPQGSATKFKADNYAVSVQRAIATAITTVKSNLPEVYRRMFSIHSGVVLTISAASGETEFVLPAGFVYTSGRVWKNLEGPWRDRLDADAIEVTINSGKAILPEPAEAEDIYVGDFIPDGNNVPELIRTFALRVACNELVRRIPALISDQDRQSLDTDLMFLRNDLKDLRRKELKIDEWDELYKNLIQETQTVRPPRCNVIDAGGW